MVKYFFIMSRKSGCGEVWYRAWFGSKRPRVRIPTLRPLFLIRTLPYCHCDDWGSVHIQTDHIKGSTVLVLPFNIHILQKDAR